ncbi:hypothetical protein, partial [Alistipes finegoldii]
LSITVNLFQDGTPRNGCNIAPGTDPAMETVTEDFQNFSQRFSGADFSHRQMGPFACRVATQRFA